MRLLIDEHGADTGLPHLWESRAGEVILLVGLEGMAYEEVAAVLNVPIGTVRSRLSRGRDQLRRLMDVEQSAETAGARAA